MVWNKKACCARFIVPVLSLLTNSCSFAYVDLDVLALFGEAASRILDDNTGSPVSGVDTLLEGLALAKHGKEATNEGITGAVSINESLRCEGGHGVLRGGVLSEVSREVLKRIARSGL